MQILVIEDEARILAFVARALKADGWTVGVAEDGRKGLAWALAHPYDLVVLDLLLPGIDGFTLLRQLREQKPDLPVLILSARSDLQSRLHGFALGADDYLVKPFSLDELLARVRVRLRRRPPQSVGDAYMLLPAGLMLDLATREARIGTQVSELTDGEFRAAALPARASGPGPEPRAVAGRRLGVRLRPPFQCGRRVHSQAPPEARA